MKKIKALILKKTKEALKASEKLNKSVIESSFDCIKVLDLNGNLQFMSRGGQKLLEIKNIKPYLNKSWIAFWKGKDNKAARKAVSEAKNGRIGKFKGYCPTPKGTPKWWDIVITPIRGSDGKIRNLLSISRDITEQKKAEEKIKESEEKFRTLISNIPDAIYSALPDETGTTTFMSERWKDWTGYSPKEFYKDPETWPKSIHPKDRDKAVNNYIQAYKKKKEYDFEYRVVHKDTGKIYYLRDHGTPIRDKKGKIIRIDGVVTDITERKKAEEKQKEILTRVKKLAETASKINKGNLKVKIDSQLKKSKDEVGDLARAFDILTTAIKFIQQQNKKELRSKKK